MHKAAETRPNKGISRKSRTASMLPLLCQEPHPRSARKITPAMDPVGRNRCGVQLLRCVGGKHSWRTFVPNPWSAR